MARGLKPSDSQTALPVQEDSDDSFASVEGTASVHTARSHVSYVSLASLRSGAASLMGGLKERASGLLEAGRGAVRAAEAPADPPLDAVQSEEGSEAAAPVGLVCALYRRASRTFQAAEAALLEYTTTVRVAAAAAREDLVSKGLRAWVADVTSSARERARGSAAVLTSTAADTCDSARKHVAEQAAEMADAARARASELGAGARSLAADPTVQVSAASAASGAVALGAGAGATGLAAGSALGAAVGLVPALFTFGLSIPVGAAIGGGAGLAVGTAVGGTVGAVGGGAAGYGAYSRREEIRKCADYVKAGAGEATEFVRGSSTAALSRAREAADFTKTQAYASAGYVAERASAARSRLAGRSGTGGTETAD